MVVAVIFTWLCLIPWWSLSENLLDAGVQSDKMEADVRWSSALREEMMDVPINFRVNLLEHDISLRDLMELQPGDIIPVAMPENATMFVEGASHISRKNGTFG